MLKTFSSLFFGENESTETSNNSDSENDWLFVDERDVKLAEEDARKNRSKCSDCSPEGRSPSFTIGPADKGTKVSSNADEEGITKSTEDVAAELASASVDILCKEQQSREGDCSSDGSSQTTEHASSDGEWLITPPQIFTLQDRTEILSTSPMEDLFIEHPSMSVYENSTGSLTQSEVMFETLAYPTLHPYLTPPHSDASDDVQSVLSLEEQNAGWDDGIAEENPAALVGAHAPRHRYVGVLPRGQVTKACILEQKGRQRTERKKLSRKALEHGNRTRVNNNHVATKCRNHIILPKSRCTSRKC